MSQITTPASRPAELPVPRTRRDIVGTSIAAALLLAFLGFTLFFALKNLLHPRGLGWLPLAASLVWVLLVAGVFTGLCYGAGGMRPQLVLMLGGFSRRHFVRIESTDSAQRLVCLGYRLLGLTFYYRKVELSGVTGVGWNTGQLSDRAGRDVDDWSVGLWYESSAVRSGLSPWHCEPEELDIVGLSGPKEPTERFGRALVEFLIAAGAKLEADGEGRRQFVRQVPSPRRGEG